MTDEQTDATRKQVPMPAGRPTDGSDGPHTDTDTHGNSPLAHRRGEMSAVEANRVSGVGGPHTSDGAEASADARFEARLRTLRPAALGAGLRAGLLAKLAEAEESVPMGRVSPRGTRTWLRWATGVAAVLVMGGLTWWVWTSLTTGGGATIVAGDKDGNRVIPPVKQSDPAPGKTVTPDNGGGRRDPWPATATADDRPTWGRYLAVLAEGGEKALDAQLARQSGRRIGVAGKDVAAVGTLPVRALVPDRLSGWQ